MKLALCVLAAFFISCKSLNSKVSPEGYHVSTSQNPTTPQRETCADTDTVVFSLAIGSGYIRNPQALDKWGIPKFGSYVSADKSQNIILELCETDSGAAAIVKITFLYVKDSESRQMTVFVNEKSDVKGLDKLLFEQSADTLYINTSPNSNESFFVKGLYGNLSFAGPVKKNADGSWEISPDPLIAGNMTFGDVTKGLCAPPNASYDAQERKRKFDMLSAKFETTECWAHAGDRTIEYKVMEFSVIDNNPLLPESVRGQKKIYKLDQFGGIFDYKVTHHNMNDRLTWTLPFGSYEIQYVGVADHENERDQLIETVYRVKYQNETQQEWHCKYSDPNPCPN